MKIETAGQDALIVYFADQTSPTVSAKIQQAVANIQEQMSDIIVDLVPSYASLMIIYDINICDHFETKRRLREALFDLDITSFGDHDLVTLPVYYSLESGPDLKIVGERSNISPEEVIEIHIQGQYRVYAIGFAPGFAYLGEVDERIAATPSSLSPRTKTGAVHTREKMLDQVRQICQHGTVTSVSGQTLNLAPDTLCVHGDNEEGVAAIIEIRDIIHQ